MEKTFFLLAGAAFFILSSTPAYAQDGDTARDISGEPTVNFSPVEASMPEAEPPGYLDTDYEPEKIQSSFLGAPAGLSESNPYRSYSPLTDSEASPASPGAGYSRESDLIGERSTEYEPEPPYNNE